MNKKSSLAFICFCILNIFPLDANAGINKKDYQSKVAKELISVIGNDKKLEEKAISIVNKSNQSLLCKFTVWDTVNGVFAMKSALAKTSNTMTNVPGMTKSMQDQMMNDVVKNFEEETKGSLSYVDRYCK